MIQHSPAQVIGAYLISTAGYFTAPGSNGEWPLYVNSMPKTPVELGTTYNNYGPMDGREFPTGRTVEHPGFSIMLRTQQDLRASQKANEIFAALDAVFNVDIIIDSINYRIYSAHRTSPMLPVKEEEGGGRLLFSINGILTYRSL